MTVSVDLSRKQPLCFMCHKKLKTSDTNEVQDVLTGTRYRVHDKHEHEVRRALGQE